MINAVPKMVSSFRGNAMGNSFVVCVGFVATSIVEGATPLFVRVRKDDEVVLAEALWWERQGRPDKADEVLEAYC